MKNKTIGEKFSYFFKSLASKNMIIGFVAVLVLLVVVGVVGRMV